MEKGTFLHLEENSFIRLEHGIDIRIEGKFAFRKDIINPEMTIFTDFAN